MKVDFPTTIGSVAGDAGGTLLAGDPGRAIRTVTTDSRELGEENLFIPLVGEKFDGHSFIGPLAESGCLAGFLTMREEHRALAERHNVAAVLCDDTLRSFGKMASRHRDLINPAVIGITGTNGKTTTKEILWAIMSGKDRCLKNDKNYNNEVGVPFTLLRLRKGDRTAVIEMGMNHSGELDRLSRIARPDIVLITNIGEGHLEFLGSVENVALAKSEIMHGMKAGSLLFLNRETQCFDVLRKKAADLGLVLKTFGLSGGADIRPESYRLLMDRMEIKIYGEIFKAPLYGIHNVYNVVGALAVALEMGVEPAAAREALSSFRNIDMRSQVIDRGFFLINDTYNSNPLSARYALLSVKEIFPGRRKIAVLSDMKELGESSAYYHREAGRMVREAGFDLLFTWGDMSGGTAEEAVKAGMKKESVRHFEEKQELINGLSGIIGKDDVVLVKGSRSMKMEEVVEALLHG